MNYRRWSVEVLSQFWRWCLLVFFFFFPGDKMQVGGVSPLVVLSFTSLVTGHTRGYWSWWQACEYFRGGTIILYWVCPVPRRVAVWCLACLVFAVVPVRQQKRLSVIKEVEITCQIQPKFFPEVIGAFGMAVPDYINITNSLRNLYWIKCEIKNKLIKWSLPKLTWLFHLFYTACEFCFKGTSQI